MKTKTFLISLVASCICLQNFAQMKNISINTGSANDIGINGDIILPNQGVNDPHIHVFKDKAYLYSSHDVGEGNSDYTMLDWQLFSSQDLVHWKKEFVLKPQNTYVGTTTQCFATDGAERNGKYYFYFSNSNKDTGVAVSTNGPGGPYKDALGKPMLAADLHWNKEYDPTIFIDDNNTPYIIWGYTGWGAYYQIAQLNEDMTSITGPQRDLVVIDDRLQNDGGYLHKHNGIYYLNTHQGEYASSKNLFGPYTYRGKIAAGGDHGTFFKWHNQTYYTWGEWKSPFFRHTKLSYTHYKDNGEIVVDRTIGNPGIGVGRYNASWNRIEAEWYFAASDKLSKRQNASGFEVRNIQNNTYLFYPKVHNLPNKTSIQLRVSSNTNGGTIEVHEGSTGGKLLGSCAVSNTGGWNKYTTVNCNLSSNGNAKNLYFVFKGGSGELMRLDWFRVTKGNISTSATDSPIGKTIWLKANNGVNGYVTAERNIVNAPVKANRIVIGAWEKFKVVDAGNGRIALKANANGKYLQAMKHLSGAPLGAIATTIQGWEQFTWENRGNGKVALKANANGLYVQAKLHLNGAPLGAIAKNVQGWETFDWGITSAKQLESDIIDLGDNAFTIYPNPITGNELTIALKNGKSKALIQILDLQGRILKKTETYENQIQLNSTIFPSSGIYMIQVLFDGVAQVQKLVYKNE